MLPLIAPGLAGEAAFLAWDVRCWSLACIAGVWRKLRSHGTGPLRRIAGVGVVVISIACEAIRKTKKHFPAANTCCLVSRRTLTRETREAQSAFIGVST